jgi:seryl-tRNA synthetase
MTKNSTEGENLSRIKEILFGEDLTSIEDKFDLFRKESLGAISKLEADLVEKIGKLEKLISVGKEKTEKLQGENNQFQKSINKAINNDISKISAQVEEEKVKFNKLLIETEKKTKDNSRKLEENIISALNNLKKEINAKIDDLYNSKVSNELVADIFEGIAEKLRK